MKSWPLLSRKGPFLYQQSKSFGLFLWKLSGGKPLDKFNQTSDGVKSLPEVSVLYTLEESTIGRRRNS